MRNDQPYQRIKDNPQTTKRRIRAKWPTPYSWLWFHVISNLYDKGFLHTPNLIMVTKEISLWVLYPFLSRIHTHYIFVSNKDFTLEASHWSWLKTSSNIPIHKVHKMIPFRRRQFFSYPKPKSKKDFTLCKIKVFFYWKSPLWLTIAPLSLKITQVGEIVYTVWNCKLGSIDAMLGNTFP